MEKKNAGIEEIITTFSSHIGKNYPSPETFRRNFDLLLKAKRERTDEKGYALSLEKNIMFLSDLMADAERLLNELLGIADATGKSGGEFSSVLNNMESRAHQAANRRHREAFIEGTVPEFKDLFAERQTGGAAYVERLEFNYRYLMTLRIFIFEFISVLAAIRAEYAIPRAGSDTSRRIRDHIEITAHFYLGNITVGKEGAG